MGLAALLIGIFGGLAGLSLAVYGHMAVAFLGFGGLPESTQNLAKALLYGLPVASFIGAGTAMSSPGFAALLLLGSAAGWVLIGNLFGSAVNVFTASAIVLDGLAGLLALGAAFKSSSADTDRIKISSEDRTYSPQPVNIVARAHLSEEYDEKKWQALLRYDEEISRVAHLVAPLGQKWSDRLAADYLAINDKQYLPEIARKIILDVKRERDEEAASSTKREQHEELQALRENKQEQQERSATKYVVSIVVALFGVAFLTLAVVHYLNAEKPKLNVSPVPDYAWEYPKKFPAQYAALRAVLPNDYASSAGFEWLYGLEGVGSEIVSRIVDGRTYSGGSVCKPHDCADNRVVFLVSEDSSQVLGTLTVAGVGRPIGTRLPLSSAELGVLSRLSRGQ